MLTFGSLFTGIGGFDLGLERAGMKCLWQVEIDGYCTRVLEKHWPEVQRFGDIKSIREGELRHVDVICGGFPCQDISIANPNGKGLDGERSSLWFAMLEIIRMVRPRYVIVENSSNIINKGLSVVLRGLAESGYDAEWETIRASSFGSPQIRERTYVIAYRNCERMAWVFDESSKDKQPFNATLSERVLDYWKDNPLHEPIFHGMANGVSRRLERTKCLGNAVVPQVAEFIGKRIVEMEM